MQLCALDTVAGMTEHSRRKELVECSTYLLCLLAYFLSLHGQSS